MPWAFVFFVKIPFPLCLDSQKWYNLPMPRRGPLREQLLAFEPREESEAGHRRRMLELLDSAADPFSRSHFEPGHFTASAFVLSPDRASLLLIFHGKFERWLQPGGHVDPGDSDLRAAACREVLEETGLNIQRSTLNIQPPTSRTDTIERWTLNVERWMLNPLDLDIHPIPPNPRRGEPGHEHFDVRYLFVAAEVAHVAGSDARESRWVALEEVDERLTDASVLRAVGKIRSETLGFTRPRVRRDRQEEVF